MSYMDDFLYFFASFMHKLADQHIYPIGKGHDPHENKIWQQITDPILVSGIEIHFLGWHNKMIGV